MQKQPLRKLTPTEQLRLHTLIQKAKGNGKTVSAQDSIPYRTMYPDGMCHIRDNLYSRSIRFEELNYDVSQTEGRELPRLATELQDHNENKPDSLCEAVKRISPVPISYDQLSPEIHGYFDLADKKIVIRDGMSQTQTLKTTIHEIAHAMLHDFDLNAPKEERKDLPNSRTHEVQAESIAYSVCKYFGLDTAEYSFGYIAGWSKSKELDQLKQSLETIHDTAAVMIASIEEQLWAKDNVVTVSDSVIDTLHTLKSEVGKTPHKELYTNEISI